MAQACSDTIDPQIEADSGKPRKDCKILILGVQPSSAHFAKLSLTSELCGQALGKAVNRLSQSR